MGHLGKHLLGTMNGLPAAGRQVRLGRLHGDPVQTRAGLRWRLDGHHPGGHHPGGPLLASPGACGCTRGS